MHIDYHTHHARCGHAIGQLEEYVKRGIEIGLDHLGLSDHMPLIHIKPEEYYPEMAMSMDELPRYVEECLLLKERYKGQIEIRMGLEGDYIEGYEMEIEKIIQDYPWDYVIGSVHFLGKWDITDYRQTHGWEDREPIAVYRRYYDAVQKAAETGLYDIMGHLDVIKRFGFKPGPEHADEVIHLENTALAAVRKSGSVMELNASGLSKDCKEMFPSRRMVEEAIALGIPLTLGSDAHQPGKLGEYLDQARALLQELGVRHLAAFEGRERVMVAL
ncbi:histidinol-phosphatase HisJ [Paenibacillus lemnae]|uniref:Histidinol-phosphatase n=1 Tax=Paenibacillus lemnae TaxID=1330551 RepID=A0A848M842_PAELE|nr:histidinol-phosphatase HisJ [Paenibacillus lemnae]NMO97197.1 histidinol-phosphatase HisJ [Paenibacillus lemnae]